MVVKMMVSFHFLGTCRHTEDNKCEFKVLEVLGSNSIRFLLTGTRTLSLRIRVINTKTHSTLKERDMEGRYGQFYEYLLTRYRGRLLLKLIRNLMF